MFEIKIAFKKENYLDQRKVERRLGDIEGYEDYCIAGHIIIAVIDNIEINIPEIILTIKDNRIHINKKDVADIQLRNISGGEAK